MLASVKEFFNSQKRTEELEQRPIKQVMRRRLGVRPTIDYDVPDISNFTHFLDCEVSPFICPMQWEELNIDFDNSDRRYCEYCDKYIFKVDNEYMLKEHNSNNECIAISNELLEKINGKTEQEKYNKLQNRLHLSKLYLVVKKYEPYFWETLQNENLSQEEILKKTITMILDTNNINFYIEKNVNMRFILEELIPNIKTQ